MNGGYVMLDFDGLIIGGDRFTKEGIYKSALEAKESNKPVFACNVRYDADGDIRKLSPISAIFTHISNETSSIFLEGASHSVSFVFEITEQDRVYS